MEQQFNSATVDQPNRPWVISLAFVCLGIIAYGYLYSKNTTSDLALLFSYKLPIGLVIWAIFHAAVGRKQGNKKAGLSFLAIFGSLVASSLIWLFATEKGSTGDNGNPEGLFIYY